MALTITDSFLKLPPELRLQILISTHSKSSVSSIIQASPIMLQQYLTHKRYILRQMLAAEFDREMIQDAMAIILFPSSRGYDIGFRHEHNELVVEHLRVWSNSQLPDPFKDNNHHLLIQLSKLHDQILLLIEDYITKATARFPPREYLCLPQIQHSSAKGHTMFKGMKVTRRFNSENLTSPERRRFVKAFLGYELLCKARRVNYRLSKRERRKVRKAEGKAILYIQSYVRSLYGAIFAQCNDAWLPSQTGDSIETGLLFPDTWYFDANVYASDLDLFPNVRNQDDDIVAVFSNLGLDQLTDFLRYDMAKPDERGALQMHAQRVWDAEAEAPIGSYARDIDLLELLRLFRFKRGSGGGFEYPLYKQLDPYPKLPYGISQQHAWVFFDDKRFYPQESPERPNFPS